MQQLSTIVSSLLILSKADAGKLDLNLESIELSKLVDGICEDAAILASHSHLHLQKTIQANLTIRGDRILLEKALQNLLSNAVKYNHPGGAVQFRLLDARGKIDLEISNTGAGIPEADRTRIFERFHRSDTSRSRETEGLGLGLNLALEIIRAHGGTLHLRKSSDKVTCFSVELPKDARA